MKLFIRMLLAICLLPMAQISHASKKPAPKAPAKSAAPKKTAQVDEEKAFLATAEGKALKANATTALQAEVSKLSARATAALKKKPSASALKSAQTAVANIQKQIASTNKNPKATAQQKASLQTKLAEAQQKVRTLTAADFDLPQDIINDTEALLAKMDTLTQQVNAASALKPATKQGLLTSIQQKRAALLKNKEYNAELEEARAERAATQSPVKTAPVADVPKASMPIEDTAAQAEQAKVAATKAQAEQERLAAEKAAQEKAEQERLAAEKAEAAAKAQAEQERLAAEKAAQEKAEQERLAAEKAEADRVAAAKAKAEQERLAAEKAAQEKAEQERLAAEKAEADRVAAAKAEQDRLAAEKAEADRVAAAKAKAEQERLAAETAAQEKAEQERLATEAAKLTYVTIIDNTGLGDLLDQINMQCTKPGEITINNPIKVTAASSSLVGLPVINKTGRTLTLSDDNALEPTSTNIPTLCLTAETPLYFIIKNTPNIADGYTNYGTKLTLVKGITNTFTLTKDANGSPLLNGQPCEKRSVVAPKNSEPTPTSTSTTQATAPATTLTTAQIAKTRENVAQFMSTLASSSVPYQGQTVPLGKALAEKSKAAANTSNFVLTNEEGMGAINSFFAVADGVIYKSIQTMLVSTSAIQQKTDAQLTQQDYNNAENNLNNLAPALQNLLTTAQNMLNVVKTACQNRNRIWTDATSVCATTCRVNAEAGKNEILSYANGACCPTGQQWDGQKCSQYSPRAVTR